MKLIARWLVNAVVLILIAYFVSGITVDGFYSALIAALILGLVNALIRPIIIILTLPINIVTLGLFTLVINALMFWLASSVVKGFNVFGFWPAFWGALLMSLASWLMSELLKQDN